MEDLNMKHYRKAILCGATLISAVVIAQAQETTPMTPQPVAQAPTKFANNEELMKLFLDDQHDRGSEPIVKFDKDGKQLPPDKKWEPLSMSAMEKRDAERRVRVRHLLDAGSVRTGYDYWVAAMIFHHGSTPDDFLLAHVLACVGIVKGDVNSRWLAAATLDRYLLETKRKQIYGTQFDGTPGAPVPDDYDKSLLNDNLRAALCVIPHEKRHQAYLAYMSGKPADLNTTLLSCFAQRE
jgi:hypothetical protein